MKISYIYPMLEEQIRILIKEVLFEEMKYLSPSTYNKALKEGKFKEEKCDKCKNVRVKWNQKNK